MCMLSVSNMIYHKFSHGAAFYMLNGKNVNVMLEYGLTSNLLMHKRLLISDRFYSWPMRTEEPPLYVGHIIGHSHT